VPDRAPRASGQNAADRVDSACGIQIAYLQKWSPRSNNPLVLRMPELLDGLGTATQLNAIECFEQHPADVTYLDPPYNQHSYLGNYHIWETLVKWDDPEVFGKARKRLSVENRKENLKSNWNYKTRVKLELESTLAAVSSKYIILSFNDRGYLSRKQIEDEMSKNFDFEVKELVHPAYIGHKIGVYNRAGNKVGTPGASTVLEYLFVGERENSVDTLAPLVILPS